MPEYPDFIGPSYTLASKNAAQDRCVNLYPSKIEFGGKTRYELRHTPGLSPFVTIPKVPGRALWSGENRLFAVGDDTLYEVTTGVAVVVGAMNSAATPATIFSNGRQLMIVNGSQVWIATGTSVVRPSYGALTGLVNTTGTSVAATGTLKFPSTLAGLNVTINGVVYLVDSWINESNIILTTSAGVQALVTFNFTDFVNGVAGAVIGGYFAVLSPNSNTVNVSAVFNGLSWYSLDYQDRSARADRLQMLYVVGNNLWLLGTKTSEVWALSASAFPLDLIPGSVVDYGIWAPFSVAACGDSSIAWLSGSDRGIGPVILARGIGAGALQRISTDAVDEAIQGYNDATDAVGSVHTKDGHTFYILNFPGAKKTWVYDLTEKLWHERTYLSGGTTEVGQIQRFYAGFGREIMALAPASGKVYQVRSDVYDDDGVDIVRTRQAGHISHEQKWLFYSSLQLDCNTGQGIVANPSYTLEISNDGGNTFPMQIIQIGGAVAAYKTRIYWNRLGRSRDRVFRVTTRARNPQSWVAAYLEFQKGNGS